MCAHIEEIRAPAHDTPSKSGGGALFNKACHPLGPALFHSKPELTSSRTASRFDRLIVSAVALQVLKHQPEASGEFFRVMQNVDDFRSHYRAV